MANLQVRSIDDQLYVALGRRAKMENRSISQEVISILKKHLSSPVSQHEKNTQNFLELCGTWESEKSSEQIIEEIKQSRRTDGRLKVEF